ncbi:hypothetical protein PQX77_015529 [Marasmius sp. AFHP31]|nr:hypothetical protein PQX77_015529 [Marasmius sp. AFHP31]
MFRKVAQLVPSKVVAPPPPIGSASHPSSSQLVSASGISPRSVSVALDFPHDPPRPTSGEDDDIQLLPSPNEIPIDIDALPSPRIHSNSTVLDRDLSSYDTAQGFQPQLPLGKTPEDIYPFYLHRTSSLAWNYSVKDHIIILHHRQCNEILTFTEGTTPDFMLTDPGDHSGWTCENCLDLPKDNNLSGILRRFETGVPLHAAYRYHGFEGIVEIAQKYRDRAETKRLGELNMARKLVVRQKALSMHKKFLVRVGEGDYERVDRLVSVWMRRNGGIDSLMKMYEGAATGKLRVFGYTEKDYL